MDALPQLSVIPYPAVVDFVGPDAYVLPSTPSIACADGLAAQAQFLRDGLRQRFATPANHLQQQQQQHAMQDAGQGAQHDISLQLLDALPALQQFRWRQEGYELVCGAGGVRITALTTTGIFYGVQTLLQALQPSNLGQQQLRMPHTRVLDAPRFIWRGVLLDAGRHFFPVPFILKLLDLLALYKMNRFHWHLTEDQGWRLEVPALPRLAEVGAWRGRRPAAASGAAHGGQQERDGARRSLEQQRAQDQQQQQGQGLDQQQQQQPASGGKGGQRDPASVLGRPAPSAAVFHGGYYSQADVAQVVAYAAARCIEVVPEIELPGHCVAALAAYPDLSCTGEVSAVSTHWGIHEDVYCAGNEGVFTFLETVLDQVVGQFPCAYIHIGGDEVPKVRWEECPRCQARMDEEGLGSEAELQSWFVRRISRHLAKRNRRLIGWDEILEGGLAEGATVMSWRGNVGGIIAARSGHDVIMTPTSHCYFDYRQAASAAEPGAWYACLPLQVVYDYDPIPGPAAAAAAAAACGEEGQEGPSAMDAAPAAPGEEEAGGQPGGGGEDGQQAAAVGAGARAGGGEGPGCPQQQQQQAMTPDDAVMATSPPGSSAGGGSPMSSRQMEDASSGGGGRRDSGDEQEQQQLEQQQQQQQQRGLGVAGAGPAVVPPAAAQAAGPHYPGHPPGASLAPLAAAAAAAASGSGGGGQAGGGGGGGAAAGRQGGGALTDAEAEHILGSQANLWTEYVADEATAEYMLLPRLAALAEAVWTPVAVKDWGRFMSRLQRHEVLLDHLGYLHRPLGQ